MAARSWLDHAGHHYDFWVSVDTDHVPLENVAERLLGYFRDPAVAFVVGPQVYGNDSGFVLRAAESQQYLFHSVLQRAANSHRARLLRPGAVTHQTDTGQRSVALDITPQQHGLDLSLDPREGITPSGWYMLLLVDDKGTPSVGGWIHVL